MKKKGNSEDSLFFSNCKLGLWGRKPLDASHGLLGWVSGSFWRTFGSVLGFIEGLFVPLGRLPGAPKAGKILRPLRDCFRSLVGPFFGPLRGLGFLGSLWEVLEASPRPLGASCSRSWAHLGPVPGRSGAVLGASWAVLGPSWPVLGPSWGALGRSWRGLGGLFGRLGALEARNGEKAKNIEKTNKNQRFWPL